MYFIFFCVAKPSFDPLHKQYKHFACRPPTPLFDYEDDSPEGWHYESSIRYQVTKIKYWVSNISYKKKPKTKQAKLCCVVGSTHTLD